MCKYCAAKEMCSLHQDDGDCEILSEYEKMLRDELYSLPHLAQVDFPVVEEYISVCMRLTLLSIYYRAVGEFQLEKADGVPGVRVASHPVRKYESILANRQLRLADVLGLTPDSRRRMKVSAIQTMDLATRIQKLKEDEDAN